MSVTTAVLFLGLIGALVWAWPALAREAQRDTIRDYTRRIGARHELIDDAFVVKGQKPARLDYLIVGIDGADTITLSKDSLRELQRTGKVSAPIMVETFAFCQAATDATLFQDLFVYAHPSGLPDGLGACARARYLDVTSFFGGRHQLYDLGTLSLVAAWEGPPPPVPRWLGQP